MRKIAAGEAQQNRMSCALAYLDRPQDRRRSLQTRRSSRWRKTAHAVHRHRILRHDLDPRGRPCAGGPVRKHPDRFMNDGLDQGFFRTRARILSNSRKDSFELAQGFFRTRARILFELAQGFFRTRARILSNFAQGFFRTRRKDSFELAQGFFRTRARILSNSRKDSFELAQGFFRTRARILSNSRKDSFELAQGFFRTRARILSNSRKDSFELAQGFFRTRARILSNSRKDSFELAQGLFFRSGSAAGCAARLSSPSALTRTFGLRPSSGLCPRARGRTKGIAQIFYHSLRQGRALPHISRQSR